MNKAEALITLTGTIEVIQSAGITQDNLDLKDSEMLNLFSRVANIVENHDNLMKEISDDEYKETLLHLMNMSLDVLEGKVVE